MNEKRYTMKAYAKINLMLDILGKKENGYHDLDMVMQQVSLSDEVSLSFISKDEEDMLREHGIPALFGQQSCPKSTACKNLDSPCFPPVFLRVMPCLSAENVETSPSTHLEISDPQKNIAALAVKSCLDVLPSKNVPQNALLLEIKKNIPIAAGLAGGSTDAAAALILTNKLLGLGLSTDKLMEIGVKSGADIPYCILGGTARAEGIGEVLTPLPSLKNCHILLVKPPIDVSTAWAYHEYDRLLPRLSKRQQAMIDVLCSENPDINEISALLGNVLELVTIPKHPEINDIKDKMKNLGALGSMMSGSGPTVFGIYKEEKTAELAAEHFKKTYKEVFVTNCVS